LQLPANSSCTDSCTTKPEIDRNLTSSYPVDPELSKVIAAWETLPEHLKAAVLALVATVEKI